MKIDTADYLVSKMMKNETCYIGAPNLYEITCLLMITLTPICWP